MCVVGREWRRERGREGLRKCLVEWDKWAYKVRRCRRKWAVEKVTRWAFRGLYVGCQVQRMGDGKWKREVWKRWRAK